MGIFTKIKDWIGTQLDVYKVEDASDVGAGLKRHIWVGKDTATQQGTTLTAQLMNELQKGLLFSTSGTRTVGSNKDIYTLDIQGMKEFGIFNGLNLLLRVDGINQYSNVVLKIDDREYQIFRLKNGNYKYFEKGMLTPGRDYLIHFDGTQFTIVQDFNFGTEPGTLLEGAELAKILGVEKIGGLITETGIKQVGYAYYDVATRSYYLCKNTNSQTYIDNNNFRAFSNAKLLDKLENLSEIRVLKNTEIESRLSLYFESCALTKIGNIVIFNGYMKKNYNTYINVAGTVLFTFPYRPLSETWVEPFFTIRQNGDFEVGAHGAFNTNKINEPRHINFVYVCQN